MLGKAAPDAQVSGKLPLMVLLFSARMVSLGKALFWPQAGGRVPVIWFPVSVSSLRKEARLSAELHQAAVASARFPTQRRQTAHVSMCDSVRNCAAGVAVCKLSVACHTLARLLVHEP